LAGRKPSRETIIAGVLTHPPQTPYDVIIIDAGSNDAIEEGKAVYLPEGPSLGVVSEVSNSNSRVRLFSSSGEKTNAVLERHNVPVELEGLGAGNFRLMLPRDAEVEVGDRILSPDISSRLLAVVGDISRSPTDSFKEVRAKSPANIFILRFVFVEP
jgi:cell shape-determining protein MreC